MIVRRTSEGVNGMNRNVTTEELRGLDIFETCTERELAQLLPHVFHRTYRKGQLLFMEGDPRERIYFLLEGYVRLERLNLAGTLQYSDYLKPCQLFPYSGIFEDEFYRYTAEALTDIEVYYVPTYQLEQMAKRHSAMLFHIIKQMNRLLDLHERRVQEIITPNATVRVINTIHFLMEDLGDTREDGIHVSCPFTTIELSRLSGTSRETVSGVLSKLRKDNIIRFSAKHLIIGKPDFFVKE
nr:Crp/Fnr family transcriptional regulator [Exiguobacterium sp. KRL4]